MQKILEFIYIGVITPFVYALYVIFAVLITFSLGLPIAIGIYLIQMFINFILHGGIFYASI